MADEIWRKVLGFFTKEQPGAAPGAQLQHYAVLQDCGHDVAVGHGQVPARLRCQTCEAAQPGGASA